MHLSPLCVRVGATQHAGPTVQVCLRPLKECRADGDAEFAAAGRHVPKRARVQPAVEGLCPPDGLAGGGGRDTTNRRRGVQQPHGACRSRQQRSAARRRVGHAGQLGGELHRDVLHVPQLQHVRRRVADALAVLLQHPLQKVTHSVHLAKLLVRRQQLGGQSGVLLLGGAAGAGASQRVGRQPPAVETEQLLRRTAQKGRVGVRLQQE
mmetsp:Transcript_29684/g.95869  ORF Transcript_29684/g.95869 Transcript_29684/m.95869 type:complete len:208 (-) Transcript_29684:75-698(-)